MKGFIFKELIISLLIKEKSEIMGHSKFINYEFAFGFHLPTAGWWMKHTIYLKVQRRVSACLNAAISQNHTTVTVLNKLDQDNSK